jgi:hypothetical protein
VNLLLTRRCDQGCAFCYAHDWLAEDTPSELGALLPALDHYAGLVRTAGPPPAWTQTGDPGALLAIGAATVNLLGGEPTAHPGFEDLVRHIRTLGLRAHLFTSGAHPEAVRAVADLLGFVTINGHFAHRASQLGVAPARLCAHLPLRPDDDVAALLSAVAAQGIPSAVLAFAAPAGGARGPFFTPQDRPAMAAVHAAAVEAARGLGLTIGWDCAPPSCVIPEAHGRCLPVPVLDAQGKVSVCGGAYMHPAWQRPIDEFASLRALHEWTQQLYRELSERRTPWEACTTCPDLGQRCYGMCLGWRDSA